METLPIVALMLVIGANAETQETRAEIRSFIVTVNRDFRYADEAANQLLYCQERTGVDARLMAALVAQERRWSLRPNPPYTSENLCQILHSTGRRCFGRAKAPTWQHNLLWGARYLSWCLAAEKGNVTHALRRYNGGPRWRKKDKKHQAHTEAYARAVNYYLGRIGAK